VPHSQEAEWVLQYASLIFLIMKACAQAVSYFYNYTECKL